MTKITFARFMTIPVLALALAACGDRRDDRASMDPGLSSDLSLASQSAMYPPQMYVSPMEMGYAGGYQPAYATQRPVYAQPAPRPRVVRTSSTATTSADAGVIRNTKRDAILGATAGAVIGATTSRDRLKGAVIGAAAGGLLGAVIGHQVDVQRQR